MNLFPPGTTARFITNQRAEACPLAWVHTSIQLPAHFSIVEKKASSIRNGRGPAKLLWTSFWRYLGRFRAATRVAYQHRLLGPLTWAAYLNTGSRNCASLAAESFSTSAWRLLPCASMVTIAAKPSTCKCHIASGMPNSMKSTLFTFLMHSA